VISLEGSDCALGGQELEGASPNSDSLQLFQSELWWFGELRGAKELRRTIGTFGIRPLAGSRAIPTSKSTSWDQNNRESILHFNTEIRPFYSDISGFRGRDDLKWS
jgi:hypothetical protein